MKNNKFFKKTIYLKTALSTNTLLKKGDYKDKTVVYTFHQTKGRGRGDKKWIDFKDKNIALSFILKENLFLNNTWYVASVSLALLEILKNDLKIEGCWIKWPNDVFINENKIAGILAESIWENKKIERLIVGIGININSTRLELDTIDKRTTSIFIETGKIQDKKKFAKKLINSISKYLEILNSPTGTKAIKEEWVKSCNIIGKNVSWTNQNESLNGKIIGIDDNGFLELKTADANIKLVSGEIKII